MRGGIATPVAGARHPSIRVRGGRWSAESDRPVASGWFREALAGSLRGSCPVVSRMIHPSRRAFLGATLAAGTALLLPGLAGATVHPAGVPAFRRLQLYNTHTAETLDVTYFEQGIYHDEALAGIDHILRDHRANLAAPMSRGLIDLVHDIAQAVDANGPVHIISGYRSPQTNDLLRRTGGGGVAKRSLHMDGIAMDIRIPGRDLAMVRDAAWALQRGGVGFYPGQQFVHVDTGRVRRWG